MLSSGSVGARREPSMAALVLITGMTALTTDTYVAALPDVQASLGTTATVAQLTMTACMIGMAAGQLVFAPISDARGRRTLILLAVVGFMITSALCAIATTGWSLTVARAVQGMACGAATAIGRAMISDAYVGRLAAAKFGTLSAVSLLAPVIGPVIGGVLVTVASWRALFWFLAAVGILMLLCGVAGLPETLAPEQRQPAGIRQLVARSRSLLADRAFAVPVLAQCLTVAGFFVYIGGSAFVLQEDVGVSLPLYTTIFAVNAAAMMLATATFRALVLRVGPEILRRIGRAIQTVSVTALFVVALVWPGPPPLVVIWVCLTGMTLGLGIFFPGNTALAQEAGRRFGGTASAIVGGIPFLIGALATPLTGVVGSQSVPAMATGMFVLFALAAATPRLVSVGGRSGHHRR